MDTLCAYQSSEDTDADADANPDSDAAPRRKLPALPTSLYPAPPHEDDPAQHQGRTRTHPHVDGQFAAHVYVRVRLDDKLRSSIARVVRGDGVHIVEDDEDGEEKAVHVSVSRPVYLRAHQRRPFRDAVRDVAARSKPFTASFAGFTALANDTHTRAFLALHIGAGHDSLCTLAHGLAPFLHSIHQQAYYTRPQFHASILWTLMIPPAGDTTPLDQYLPALRSTLSETLLRAGPFVIDRLFVRVGKHVRSYPLRGESGALNDLP